jgi:putative DNA primase/helicase
LFVPFDQEISEEECNREMNTTRFWEETGELPGILNMVIRGLLRVVKNQAFTKSQSSDEALEDYKYDSDSVLSFVQNEGYVPCDGTKVKLTEFYSDYAWYCKSNGLKVASIKTVAQRLRNMKYVVEKGNGNVNYVHCIKSELQDLQTLIHAKGDAVDI